MRGTAALLLLAASAALACVDTGYRRTKREELLKRAKRRWVLSTIEITEEDEGPFPKEISQMYNDQIDKVAKTKFRISGAGVTEEPMDVFSIDEDNGKVYAHKAIDREKKSCFHIQFDILDKSTGEPIDNKLSFDVEIKDLNDNDPKFLRPKIIESVKENAEEGYLAVRLQAMDPDQPNSPNSTMSFSLVSQTPAEPKIELKQMDDRTAQLTYNGGCFDYDKAKVYNIIAKVQDHGTPPRSSTASITLKILDTNTHLPTFKETMYHGEVNEMAVVKDVLRVAVEDKDSPNTPGWQAKYSFVSGNENENYEIVTDPKTNEGIFSVIKGKDFERTTFTHVQIKVENVEPLFKCPYKPGPAAKHSTANITIKVIDMNDPPVFDKDKTNVHQKEEDPPGKTVFVSKVTDVDSDISKIKFVILDDPADWMKVDPNTGIVSTTKKMDRESPFVDENNVYTILVGAIDNGEPMATGTATVLIHLKDINDNKPMLLNNSVTFCAHLDEVPVKVEDSDADPYSAPFSFAFDESDKKVSEYWELVPTFGKESALRMVKTLAYGNYSVPLVIEDQQNMKSTETLLVVVCECGKSNTCLKQPLSVDVSGAVIGLILGSLLLFLLLLLIFACNCGKKFKKLPIGSDEGTQTLIKYNQEGGSAECKTEPSMLLPATTTTTNNITVTDGQQTLQNAKTMYTTEKTNVFNSFYQNNYGEEMGTMDMHSGGMRGAGMYNDTWTHRSGTYMGTSQYGLSQVDQHISEHLHRKLQILSAAGQSEDVGYQPHEYAYEGVGSRSQSLDQISLGNLDDVQFLNDLGPRFKTLGQICQQAIEEKNITF
ncbi:cadherin-like protein 26 [Eucyclogobius newberryi]|uniref:cadherin-like protein 26 n=1 Tax=Eucyclogobius newberryi TaxID=166745 RepID=UPI003B5BA9B7